MDTVRRSLSKFKPRHLVPLAAVGGIAIAAFSLGGTPLLSTVDDFVLFAQENVTLEQNVQVSSGDVGSNNKVTIDKESLITGDLFADSITLDKEVVVNGKAVFNELKTKKDTAILGATTTPVSLPIANIPEVPSFQTGTQDFTFNGDGNTLPQGNYRNITLNKESALTLTGGTYTIAKLTMKENTTLIFSTTTTINIEKELKGQHNVSILPGANTAPDDLTINYLGKKDKKKEKKKKDDDEDDNNSDDNNGDDNGDNNNDDDDDDDGEDKDDEDDDGSTTLTTGKNKSKPVTFGDNSFLNFILVAPTADVRLGKETTFRGQILAKKIVVGKDSVLSREEFFEKESDPTKVVEDEDGVQFIGNELVVLFKDTATLADAEEVAELVNGTVTGFDPNPPTYKIEILTADVSGMESAIQAILDANNPLVIEVIPNLITILF